MSDEGLDTNIKTNRSKSTSEGKRERAKPKPLIWKNEEHGGLPWWDHPRTQILLRSKKAKRKRNCALNQFFFLFGHDTTNHVFIKPRCKCWSCPTCSKVRAAKASFEIQGTIRLNGLNEQFWTLTVGPEALFRCKGNDGEAFLKACLRKWLRTVRIQLPGIRYVWVLETGEKGLFHLHIAFDQAFAPKTASKLKELWTKYSWSHAHIGKNERGHNVLVDAAFYMTKSLSGDGEMPFRLFDGRRYGISRNCLRPNVPKAISEGVTICGAVSGTISSILGFTPPTVILGEPDKDGNVWVYRVPGFQQLRDEIAELVSSDQVHYEDWWSSYIPEEPEWSQFA